MSQKRRSVADEAYWVVRTSAANLKAAAVLPNHAHEWHQLIYVSAGLMSVATEAGSWVAPATWAISGYPQVFVMEYALSSIARFAPLIFGPTGPTTIRPAARWFPYPHC